MCFKAIYAPDKCLLPKCSVMFRHSVSDQDEEKQCFHVLLESRRKENMKKIKNEKSFQFCICFRIIDLFSYLRHSWSRGLKWVNKLNIRRDATLKRGVFPKRKARTVH